MTLEYETLCLDNIKYSLNIVIYTIFLPQITFFKLKYTHLTSF